MSAKRPIGSRIFFLATLNALVCLACALLASWLGGYQLESDFVFLSAFASFVAGFLTLYYFYYVDVTHNINTLTEKIRMRFLTKEIPLKRNQLEEQDGLELLEERVDFLIETREK